MSIPVCLALIISIPRKIYEITKKKTAFSRSLENRINRLRAHFFCGRGVSDGTKRKKGFYELLSNEFHECMRHYVWFVGVFGR